MKYALAIGILLISALVVRADTVIIIRQSQTTTTQPITSGCDWTYPSSCYVSRRVIVVRKGKHK